MARRSAGVLVHHLLWSMAHDRPVRCLHRDGKKTTTGKVVRLWIDPQRQKPRLPAGSSTMVATFENGADLAVDAIEKVKKPVGDTGATFTDGS